MTFWLKEPKSILEINKNNIYNYITQIGLLLLLLLIITYPDLGIPKKQQQSCFVIPFIMIILPIFLYKEKINVEKNEFRLPNENNPYMNHTPGSRPLEHGYPLTVEHFGQKKNYNYTPLHNEDKIVEVIELKNEEQRLPKSKRQLELEKIDSKIDKFIKDKSENETIGEHINKIISKDIITEDQFEKNTHFRNFYQTAVTTMVNNTEDFKDFVYKENVNCKFNNGECGANNIDIRYHR